MTTLSVSTVIKSVLFVLVGVVAGLLVINTLRVPVGGSTDRYTLVFTDAEGIIEGNPVTMSGVRIGRVEGIVLDPQADGTAFARIDVEVQSDHPLPERMNAVIRYGDMLGARYIAVEASDDAPARDGNIVTVAATSPPVNLTALMNGFEPLFASLQPGQVNELAQGFVDTFAGRTKSVDLLLRQIATMGSDLSANSAVFARVVSNLNALMTSADQRSGQLNELFAGLGALTTSIVGDQGRLAALFDSGDRALAALVQMMTAAGDDFEGSRRAPGRLRRVDSADREVPDLPRHAAGDGRQDQSRGTVRRFHVAVHVQLHAQGRRPRANIFGTSHSKMCR